MNSALSPQEYFEKIRPLRNESEIQLVCEELTAALFNDQDQPKTRVNKLTPYNKLINEIKSEELVEKENAFIQIRADGSYWKRHLHFRFTGLSEVNWNGEGGINHKTIVLDRLENQQCVNVVNYLETACRLLLSNDPHELAVGLIAVSGRRPVEILVRGNFSKETELHDYLEPDYFVRFRGQAKKRDYDMPEAERTEYRIGVLVPSDFFLNAFKRFRKMPESIELLRFLKAETKKGTSPEVINDAVESRRGNSLRRAVAAAFGEFLPKRHGEDDLNNKALRAVYVRLVTERDCPKSINHLLWASRAVGHFVDSTKVSDKDLLHLVTTLGYSDYYVDTEVPFMPTPQKPERERVTKVGILATDLELVKGWAKEWHCSQQIAIHNTIGQAQTAKELEKKLFDAQEKNTELEGQLAQAQAKNTELEGQLAQAQAKNIELQKEIERMQELQMNIAREQLLPLVEPMVRELVHAELRQAHTEIFDGSAPTPTLEKTALVKVVSQNPTSEEAELPEVDNSRQPSKPSASERDWEGLNSEELRKTKGAGSANEKIRRSFESLTNHNNHRAVDLNGNPDINRMWAITNQALRQLSGCNGQLVSDWMQQHKLAIDDANSKYGLGQYHNKRHKQAITEVIFW